MKNNNYKYIFVSLFFLSNTYVVVAQKVKEMCQYSNDGGCSYKCTYNQKGKIITDTSSLYGDFKASFSYNRYYYNDTMLVSILGSGPQYSYEYDSLGNMIKETRYDIDSEYALDTNLTLYTYSGRRLMKKVEMRMHYLKNSEYYEYDTFLYTYTYNDLGRIIADTTNYNYHLEDGTPVFKINKYIYFKNGYVVVGNKNAYDYEAKCAMMDMTTDSIYTNAKGQPVLIKKFSNNVYNKYVVIDGFLKLFHTLKYYYNSNGLLSREVSIYGFEGNVPKSIVTFKYKYKYF